MGAASYLEIAPLMRPRPSPSVAGLDRCVTDLLPGDLPYLNASEPHALAAREDSVLLVVLLLPPSKIG